MCVRELREPARIAVGEPPGRVRFTVFPQSTAPRTDPAAVLRVGAIVNLVDSQAEAAQQAMLAIVREQPDATLGELRKLVAPAHHDVRAADVDPKRLGAVLATSTRFSDPARFAFALGGKDRHPFPVPLTTYDELLSNPQANGIVVQSRCEPPEI